MAPLQQLCVRPNLHSRFRSLQYRCLIGVSAQYAYDTEAGMTLQCPGVGGRGRSPLIYTLMLTKMNGPPDCLHKSWSNVRWVSMLRCTLLKCSPRQMPWRPPGADMASFDAQRFTSEWPSLRLPKGKGKDTKEMQTPWTTSILSVDLWNRKRMLAKNWFNMV